MPGRALAPAKSLTPRYFAAESRPSLVDPPDLVFAINQFMIQNWIEKIKAEVFKGEWLLGLIVFLLVTFAFGLGWISASQIIGRTPIIINCP
jgi:hypothetical protein